MSDFDSAARLSELEIAAKQCSKGLTYKASVSGYLRDSFSKNSRLRDELLSGTYKISKYMHFVITEPKRRDICATRMRDRVWQKSMCNNGLRDQFLTPLIYDNGACQTNKGVDFAVDRAICFLQKFYRTHGNNIGWYDHLDIKGYFQNTPHEVSKRTTAECVKDMQLRGHVYSIIDSFLDTRPPAVVAADGFGSRGTALGSEISQLVQLAVPNRIDHAIKERLRVKYYIRFNDDMLLISDDREQLARTRSYIKAEYAKIGLEVTVKQKEARLADGVKFLKRRLILTDTGKVVVKPAPGRYGKERRTLRRLKKKLDRGEVGLEQIADHYQSVRAGLARCDTKAEIKSLDHFYAALFETAPPISNRRKKNAYCKTKQQNRKKRGGSRTPAHGERKTAGNH